VALGAAQRFAARVASHTLIEPVAFQLLRGGDAPDGWREVAALAERHMALVAQERDAEAAEAFVAYWMGAAAWPRMPDTARVGVIRSMPKVAAEWALMLAAHDDVRAVGRIDAPTLLVCGGRTRAPARHVMEILRSALPGSRYLEIPDAGHMSPLSHPAAVADAVRAHVGSVPRQHRSAA
jgi:pimeloyl-ACP methyl ester carboxylesterase